MISIDDYLTKIKSTKSDTKLKLIIQEFYNLGFAKGKTLGELDGYIEATTKWRSKIREVIKIGDKNDTSKEN